MEKRIPKLFIEYGLPFDFDPKGDVPKAMAEWCQKMTPVFQKLWDDDGIPLLKPIVNRFGRGFCRNELSVYIVAHKHAVAMSHPLMLSVRNRIPPDFAEHILMPKSFIGTLFHEMMHRYIMDHVNIQSMNSPLIKKYCNESETVLYHIHLMALLTLGFTECDRQSDLLKMIEVEKTIPDPGYARAREIELAESTERVLQDLEVLFAKSL